MLYSRWRVFYGTSVQTIMGIVVAIISSSALSALISGIFNLISSSKKSRQGVDKGVQLILLGEIKRQGREYIEQGYISAEDLEAYNEMYECYHKPRSEGGLGGNGFAESVYAKVKGLEIR